MHTKFGIVSLLLLLAGCSSPPSGGDHAAAGGGAQQPSGAGGGGGDDGGSGGLPQGGAGGTGGSAGEEAPSLDPHTDLGLPGEWEYVILRDQPEKFWLFSGVTGTLEFPTPVWESCGPGCESTVLEYANWVGSVAVSTEGTAAGEIETIVSMQHGLPGERIRLLRVVRLSDGATLGAILSHPKKPGPYSDFVIVERPEGALSQLMASPHAADGPTGNLLYMTLDQVTGRWNFREPWDQSEYRAVSCSQFDLGATAYLFACPRGVEIMEQAGSSAITVIPDSQNAMMGVGNFGEAIWVEHFLELPFSSRIRAWSPESEVRTVAEIPDFVCGLGIGPDRIVGLRGMDEIYGRGCWGGLTEARFFHLPRGGGELQESPILPGEARRASSVSVYGDWMVAALGFPPTGVEPRWSIAIVRLSDWEAREIWQPEGRSIGRATVAVDDEYFYFTQEYSMPGKHGFDRLFRYRLDHFDQIGVPMFPDEDE